LEDVMSLELPALGQTGVAIARTRVDLDAALTMKSFGFTLDSEVGRFQARGEVGRDTTLSVTVVSAGSEQTLRFRLSEPPVFSSVVPIRVAMAGQLEVGNRIRLPVFDPTSLSTRTAEVRVLERGTVTVTDSVRLDPATGRWDAARTDTVPAWRISESVGGVEVESWIDDDGRILRSSSALGFSMQKTEYELARQAQEDSRLAEGSAIDDDVVLATAVQSNVDLQDARQFEE